MQYEQHEIGKLWPPLTVEEFARLKEATKNPGVKSPVIIHEGKVLDGWHWYKVCSEVEIEPTFETLEANTDPVEFVRRRHEGRRHLTQGQFAGIAEAVANLKLGSNRFKKRIAPSNEGPTSVDAAAKQFRVGKSSVEKVRSARLHTKSDELPKAVRDGFISPDKAKEISRLPENQRANAVEAAKSKSTKKAQRPVPSAAKSSNGTKPPKAALTEEQQAKDRACLEQINAPSTFPQAALIPQSQNYDEAGLRQAIEWLREREDKIASFKEEDLYQMLLRTNRIQAYQINWSRQPRPEGELDQRILDWAGDLWRRQQRQHERIDLVKSLRQGKKPERPISVKMTRSFDDRFKTFWIQIEDALSVFKSDECAKLAKAFKKELINFFSESPAGKVGTTEVVTAQDVQLVDS